MRTNFALLIPIIAVGAPFLIAIIAMMTKHQREMAELYHRNAQSVDPRIDALQRDMAEMKDLLNRQAIALDRMATPLPQADVRERIGG
jgi:hypothetical protein